jgi:chaperonin GroEL
MTDEATGIQIISRAVESPLRTIVENAGLEGSVVVAKVAEGKGDFGYNANVVVDMLKAGIIDPTNNTCCIRKCCISCRNDFNH